MSNPFNAATAEVGSRWMTIDGESLEFRTFAPDDNENVQACFRDARGFSRFRYADGSVNQGTVCDGDIIAPAAEAKPEVRREAYRPNRYANMAHKDYKPRRGDRVKTSFSNDGTGSVMEETDEGQFVVDFDGMENLRPFDASELDLIRAAGEQPGEGEVKAYPSVPALLDDISPEMANEVRDNIIERQRNSIHELEETVGKLESEANRLRSDLASRDETIERLNQMIRDTGQGQGAIDAYVAQCEDMERKDEAIRLLEGELDRLKEAVEKFLRSVRRRLVNGKQCVYKETVFPDLAVELLKAALSAQPNTVESPDRVISDSASGVGSSDASAAVDLSGVKVGDAGEISNWSLAVVYRPLGLDGDVEWRTDHDQTFFTDRFGKCHADPRCDIIRLLPPEGGQS